MKLLMSLLALSAMNAGWTDAAPTPPEKYAEAIAPRNIQILIEKDATEALLEIKGAYTLLNPHDGSRIASGHLGKRFLVRELESGLKWGEEFPGIHQFYIQPKTKETAIFVNGIQYSGSVAVFGVSGTINIVNDIDIESYVKSILSAQFSTTLEPEVLSALAILARTNAYYTATRNEQSYWHVLGPDANYSGSAIIVPNSPIERAVDSTKHLILVYSENGKNLPFATAWTEHSAGKTASYETMFRKDVQFPLKGVEAPHAALVRQESKWTYQIPKGKFAEKLGTRGVEAVDLFLDKASNKVYGIRVKDTKEFFDIDFFTLQSRLGKDHIKSSDFTVLVKDDAVQFTGYGKGHGVGLCLYSASSLAQNGENAIKILSKFFPETYLYNLNALPTGGEQ